MNKYGAVLFIGGAAGSSIVCSRFALAEIAPTLLLTIRMAIAAGCFAVLIGITRPAAPAGKRAWLDCILVGVMAIGLPLEFSFLALEYLSSGLFTILLSFTGMGTIIVAHFFLVDERATVNKLVGAGLAFVGVVILIATRTTGLVGQSDLRGYLFTVGVVLLFSFGNVYARRRLGQVDARVATAIGIGTSFIISLAATMQAGGLESLGRIGGWSWGAAIYSSVVGSFLYFYAVYWTIKKHGASTVGLAYFVIPVVSTVLGTALLGEIVTWGMLGGSLFVFGGLAMVNRSESG